jgi:hypothetical protein
LILERNITFYRKNSYEAVSTDNGATFGPVLTLATNGTIGESEEEPEKGE